MRLKSTALGLALAPAAKAIDPPSPPTVGVNVKINDTFGRDGLAAQPSCCYPDSNTCTPAELLDCCFNRAAVCLGGADDGLICTELNPCPSGQCVWTCPDTNGVCVGGSRDGQSCPGGCDINGVALLHPCTGGQCTASLCSAGTNQDNPCVLDSDCPANGKCLACDDDPKRQWEPAIAADPASAGPVVAVWADLSRNFSNGPIIDMGFGLSVDAGPNWKRFDHALNPCNMSCNPATTCFVDGSSLMSIDVGVDRANPTNPCVDWLSYELFGDSSAAVGNGWLYLYGLNRESNQLSTSGAFARLRWSDPLTQWEAGNVAPVRDKPYIGANPRNEDVYVCQGAAFLSASRTAGDEFLDPALTPPVSDRPLAFASPNSPKACVPQVGPLDDVHVVWEQFISAGQHQIRYRRGTWNAGDLAFSPPLPPNAVDLSGRCFRG